MPKSEINRGPDFVPEQIIPIPTGKSVVDYHFINCEPRRKQELVESILRKRKQGLVEPLTDEENAFVLWQQRGY